MGAAAECSSQSVEVATEEKQPSVWELLDELIPGNRSSLSKIVFCLAAVLMFIEIPLMLREVTRSRMDLVAMHGGFLFLVLGLLGSVAFVCIEASRLEDEKELAADGDAVDKKSD